MQRQLLDTTARHWTIVTVDISIIYKTLMNLHHASFTDQAICHVHKHQRLQTVTRHSKNN